MKRYCCLPVVLLNLAAARPALAQHYYRCHCCCDTTTLTEHSNRTAFLFSTGLTTDRSSRAYGGTGVEVGTAIGPRLTVGGRSWLGFARSSASSYGYAATQPVLSYYSLVSSARYQLLNARRWRLEALGSFGASGIALEDRDQLVNTGRGQRAITVFFGVYPSLEGGAGLTYKLKRDFWLLSQLSYHDLLGTGGLSSAGEFSGWQASVGVAMPWGYRPR